MPWFQVTYRATRGSISQTCAASAKYFISRDVALQDAIATAKRLEYDEFELAEENAVPLKIQTP